MATSQAKRPSSGNSLPSTVRVGAHVYTVTDHPDEWKELEYERKNTGLVGSSDHQRCRIWIKPEMSTSQKRDTLLHEVLHAVYYMAGLHVGLKGQKDDEDTEELVVVSITPWLHNVFLDNPKFVAYMSSLD